MLVVQDERELLNQWLWSNMGSPAVVSLNWPPSQPPTRLLVSWNGQEAFLPLNVDNPEVSSATRLEMEKMSADDMLWILAAADDPSAAFRIWARGRQTSDTFDSDLDSATPFRPRFSDSATGRFYVTICRPPSSTAFGAGPAFSLQLRGIFSVRYGGGQGLEWRLRGMIGIETLAERLVRDVDSTDGPAG